MTERDEFGDFLEVVLCDFTFSGHREWENNTLERLVGALAALAEARVLGKEVQDTPCWELSAEMIVAAIGHE